MSAKHLECCLQREWYATKTIEQGFHETHFNEPNDQKDNELEELKTY